MMWIGIIISSVMIFGGIKAGNPLGKALVSVFFPLANIYLDKEKTQLIGLRKARLAYLMTIFSGLAVYPIFLILSAIFSSWPIYLHGISTLIILVFYSFLAFVIMVGWELMSSRKWEKARVFDFVHHQEKMGIASHYRLPVGSGLIVENPKNGNKLFLTIVAQHQKRKEGVALGISLQGAKYLGISREGSFYVSSVPSEMTSL